MKNENNNQGCCPSVHAKIFEIILIIGFILPIILLIINLVITLWCFKCSYSLFIIEIGLLVLNFICFIISIILRCWRSDGSVLKENFSSSNSAVIFNIVLVIINILASITEDVLFSFVISFLALYLDKEFSDYILGFDIKDLEDSINDYNSLISRFEQYGMLSPEIRNDFEDELKKSKIILKKGKRFVKIMNKNYQKKLFSFLENINDSEKAEDIITKRIKTLKILPWITINFNIFMQLLMLIFLIIIINRIKLRSDFGFSQSKNDESFKNRMIGKSKISNKRKHSNNDDMLNLESDLTKIKDSKRKKKKKKHNV